MKQVAREAGVARGFIHHYLSGQEEILLEVLANASREYLAETERLAESLPEGRSFAVAALAETKARASRMPERYRLGYELFAIGIRRPEFMPGVPPRERTFGNGHDPRTRVQ